MVQVSKSEDLRKWAQRYGNLCDALATESSFKLDESEKHISATCRVLNSSTVHDDIRKQDVLTVVKFISSWTRKSSTSAKHAAENTFKPAQAQSATTKHICGP